MHNLFQIKSKLGPNNYWHQPPSASQWPSCEKEESQTNNRVGGVSGARKGLSLLLGWVGSLNGPSQPKPTEPCSTCYFFMVPHLCPLCANCDRYSGYLKRGKKLFLQVFLGPQKGTQLIIRLGRQLKWTKSTKANRALQYLLLPYGTPFVPTVRELRQVQWLLKNRFSELFWVPSYCCHNQFSAILYRDVP